jgi:hypothetical protein
LPIGLLIPGEWLEWTAASIRDPEQRLLRVASKAPPGRVESS